MHDAGTAQSEVEYKGRGISAVQERDGSWVAYVAGLHGMPAAETDLPPIVQKSQPYMTSFLAIVDMQMQIDEFEDHSLPTLVAGNPLASAGESMESVPLLGYQPLAVPGTAADVRENANSDLPPVVDKRLTARRKSLRSGAIVHDAGRYSFRCAIRDMGDSGARIEFPNGLLFPANVYLINLGAGVCHEARVTWVRESQAGLAFINSFSVKKVGDPELAYLNKIWVDLSPRYSSRIELT